MECSYSEGYWETCSDLDENALQCDEGDEEDEAEVNNIQNENPEVNFFFLCACS